MRVFAEFREAFAAFDKNRDGVITAKELGEVLRSLGENPSETELLRIINEVDLDGKRPDYFTLRRSKTKFSFSPHATAFPGIVMFVFVYDTQLFT